MSRPLLLSLLLLPPLSSIAADWKAEANSRIEQLRKRDTQIQVLDAQQKPVANVRVEIRQVNKAFPFGAAVTGALVRNTNYQQFFKAHFNWAVFGNESKWYSNERERGRTNYATADALLAWCKSNDIPVRGHCIFWEPEKWQPQWVQRLGSNDLRPALEARMDGAVNHFKGRFAHWDVDNEMLHGSFLKDRLGDDIHVWMFKRAHELDPAAKLFVNEFNILSVDQSFQSVQTDEYVAHTRELLKQGAPIGGVGIQGHIWSEDILAHPEVIKERLDKVAALKLPIWITEFDVAGTNGQENADKLELVYRTAYSHPAVEGIITWVFWAGDSWRGTNAGIARRDWTLNEAGQRFERLMREWSTMTAGATDEKGAFSFRGFHGEYEAVLTARGKPAVQRTFKLEPGNGGTIVKLQLD